MVTKIDWIQGDRFRDMAHYTFAPSVKTAKDDYDNLPNTLDLSRIKDGDIIYTHMMYTPLLFEIIQHINVRFILVSHSCDCSIEDYGMRRPNGRGLVHDIFNFELPDNLIRWYSKNVNTINDRIESIPIGVENDRWHVKVPKLDIMVEQMKQHRGVRNLVYMNHSTKTNPEKRQGLYDTFTKEKWVTSHMKGIGILMFERYIHQMYNHKFVFSPEGNGMDTIRTWECLYMGTIPIEKRNLNNRFYTDLPICFVDDWGEVNPAFLEAEYERIKAGSWNMDKLKFSYWRSKIMNTTI